MKWLRKHKLIILFSSAILAGLLGAVFVPSALVWFEESTAADARQQTWEDTRYGFWAACANCDKHFYVWVEKSTPILGASCRCGHCDVLLKFDGRNHYRCGEHAGCQSTTMENSK